MRRDHPHPGQVLREAFLQSSGLTQVQLADRLGVSFPRVNELINGKRSVTVDTALRLSRLLGTTPEYWLNLQRDWDLSRALSSDLGEIRTIKPLVDSGRANIRYWPSDTD